MQGIIVRYRYSGDEAAWRRTAEEVVKSINADEVVRGRFHYAVTVSADGVGRMHVGQWDSDETLKTVQARDYFRRFTETVKGFAGDTLESTRMSIAASTD